MRTRTPAPAGVTIQQVRPSWWALLGALVLAAIVAGSAGFGLAVIAFVLELICVAAWQAVTLLGYIAGAVSPPEDVLADEDEDAAHV